jgi:hypothetical protein
MRQRVGGVASVAVLGALLLVVPAGADLVIDIPFADSIYAPDSTSVVGKGGAETGFAAADKWAVGPGAASCTYKSAGLTFSSGGKTLQTSGGDLYVTHGGGQEINRTTSLSVLSGTLYGAYLYQPTSLHTSCWSGIGFAATAPQWSGEYSITVAPKGGYNSYQPYVRVGGTAVNGSGTPAYTLGTNYLVLFQITDIGGSGSHTLTAWVLTADQFAHFESDGTLTAAELNSAGIGSAAAQVFGRASATGSGSLATTYFAIGGSGDSTEVTHIDAIRLGTGSLDEVAPLAPPPLPPGTVFRMR